MNTITRRQLAAAATVLAVWMTLCTAAFAGSPSLQRPNVILCMTDDQGWGDTGYNGHPVLKTPHLDRMAEDGIRFEQNDIATEYPDIVERMKNVLDSWRSSCAKSDQGGDY